MPYLYTPGRETSHDVAHQSPRFFSNFRSHRNALLCLTYGLGPILVLGTAFFRDAPTSAPEEVATVCRALVRPGTWYYYWTANVDPWSSPRSPIRQRDLVMPGGKAAYHHSKAGASGSTSARVAILPMSPVYPKYGPYPQRSAEPTHLSISRGPEPAGEECTEKFIATNDGHEPFCLPVRRVCRIHFTCVGVASERFGVRDRRNRKVNWKPWVAFLPIEVVGMEPKPRRGTAKGLSVPLVRLSEDGGYYDHGRRQRKTVELRLEAARGPLLGGCCNALCYCSMVMTPTNFPAKLSSSRVALCCGAPRLRPNQWGVK